MKTRNFFLLPFIAVILLGLTGCDQSTEQDYREQLVLSGFMFINKPMSIELTHTLPFDAYYDPDEAKVHDATVTIWSFDGSDTTEYHLSEDTLTPGTYRVIDEGVDDTVRTGFYYAIRVEARGAVLTAESGRAAPPIRLDSVRLGSRRLEGYRDDVDLDTLEFGGTEEHGEPFLEYFWNQDNRREAVNITVQNLEPDWFEHEIEAAVINTWPIAYWTMQNVDGFIMPWLVVGFTGRHRISIMSCDENAYNYFLTTVPGEASNYPDSNVRGGLGLFCAIDADTIYFYLKDDIEE